MAQPSLRRHGSASVGGSAAPSAVPKLGHIFAMPYHRQPRSGRNILLHCQPARPSFGPVGEADRDIARRSSPGAHWAPFHIDAWVVLPDHMHCLWTLPPRGQFPARWRAIKSSLSNSLPAAITITGDRHRGERDLASATKRVPPPRPQAAPQGVTHRARAGSAPSRSGRPTSMMTPQIMKPVLKPASGVAAVSTTLPMT